MQFVPARMTDGRTVELVALNDYTTEKMKEEEQLYEQQKFRVIHLCPSCQGGGSDNPKGGIKG